MGKFMNLAQRNTNQNIETCGILAGTIVSILLTTMGRYKSVASIGTFCFSAVMRGITWKEMWRIFGIKKSLCTWRLQYKNSMYSNSPHAVDELKMAVTEYIQNVDHAILNMVFENTVQRVNKCLKTGGGHFEHYL
jgi:hypothetical protein